LGSSFLQQRVEETVAIGTRQDLALERAWGLFVTLGEPWERKDFSFRVLRKKIVHLSAVLLGKHRARGVQQFTIGREYPP
jgi:hypothetical protein